MSLRYRQTQETASWLSQLSVSWWPTGRLCAGFRWGGVQVEQGAGGLHWLKRMNQITVCRTDVCDWCWYTCESRRGASDRRCWWFLWRLVFLFAFYCSWFMLSCSVAVRSHCGCCRRRKLCFSDVWFICLFKSVLQLLPCLCATQVRK